MGEFVLDLLLQLFLASPSKVPIVGFQVSVVHCKISIFELSYRTLQPRTPIPLRPDLMHIKDHIIYVISKYSHDN